MLKKHSERIERQFQVVYADLARIVSDKANVSDDESDREADSFMVLRPRWRSAKVLYSSCYWRALLTNSISK